MNSDDLRLFVNREKKFRGFQKLLEPTTRQAVMLIEAPRDMGKSWLLHRMRQHCESSPAPIPVIQIDFRNPREIHDIQDFLGLVRLIRNKLATADFFNQLNATINAFTAAAPAANPALAQLRAAIERSFNLDELQGLVFDLGILYENLAGATLSAKILSLVTYTERYGLLARLVDRCAQLRPEIEWTLSAWTATAVSAAATPTTDQGGLLRTETQQERLHAMRQINDAFFAALEALMAARGQAVLLFDSVEEAPQEALDWIRDDLLARLRDGQLADAVVIITGRKTPDLSNLDIKHLLVQTGLEPFDEAIVREYFEERRQIRGLDLRTIVLTSGGVPGTLAMMADQAMAASQDDDDFFSDI